MSWLARRAAYAVSLACMGAGVALLATAACLCRASEPAEGFKS